MIYIEADDDGNIQHSIKVVTCESLYRLYIIVLKVMSLVIKARTKSHVKKGLTSSVDICTVVQENSLTLHICKMNKRFMNLVITL